MTNIIQKIEDLAEQYSINLKTKINARLKEMKDDDNAHYLIYRVFGITQQEGKLVDEYQNKGRFLYKYAGSFLEESAVLCFKDKFKHAESKVRIKNKLGVRPKNFEIDCLINNNAYEIKWRDATTDGDHITKEHTRVRNIKNAGYNPIRVMFYYPNRAQAIRIQETLKTVYNGLGGQYFFGDEAWNFIKNETSVDLLSILKDIASRK